MFFKDMPVTVDIFGQVQNPQTDVPEKAGVDAIYLKPWFNFIRTEVPNPQFSDVCRFLLRASDLAGYEPGLGGYLVFSDGTRKWFFKWISIVPWSAESDTVPTWYIAYVIRIFATSLLP